MQYRTELVALWVAKCVELELHGDPGWELAKVLVDPAEVRQWNLWGLPTDALSTDNAIILTRGQRWPLMIDPQGQANRWIRRMGVDKNIAVVKLTEKNFLRALETGIRYGQAVLLENVEEVLDPALEPVLLKAVVKKGGQLVLRLGSEDIPYSQEFHFYITTKLPNPHYLPEICIKVAVINFTVTTVGLVDQLVGAVVAHERPELDESRQQLVVQISADKAELDRIATLILQLLAESSGDILADDTLIVTLDQSGETTIAVNERMKAAESTMSQVAEARVTYTTRAERASILYFVVADM